jgi:hypothetical protein
MILSELFWFDVDGGFAPWWILVLQLTLNRFLWPRLYLVLLSTVLVPATVGVYHCFAILFLSAAPLLLLSMPRSITNDWDADRLSLAQD